MSMKQLDTIQANKEGDPIQSPQPFRLNKKRLFLLLALGLLFMSLLGLLFNRTYVSTKESYMGAEMDAFESKIYTTLELYENFSDFIFEEHINQDDVLALVEQGVFGTEDEQNAARQMLFSELSETYDAVLNYDFRQLHFHTGEGDSFLRFHAPERYGDSLMDIRDSIRIANTEERFVFGFEEGRIFNGYRFVYPLHRNGRHLGSVEVSISMGSLVQMIGSLYPDDVLTFVIREDIVRDTVFESEQTNYSPAPFFPGYALDEGISSQSESCVCDTAFSMNCSVIETIVSDNGELTGEGASFNRLTTQNGQDVLVNFLSVTNLSDQHVAYLIGMHEIEDGSVFGRYHLNRDLALLVLFFSFYAYSIFMYERKQKQLNILANTDQLTGLFNRHYMMKRLEDNRQKGAGFKQPAMLILLDIDRFKRINDEFGHQTGDAVLCETGALLKKLAGSHGTAARWGGEEFVLYLPGYAKAEGTAFAEQVRSAIETHAYSKGLSVTASIGVSSTEDPDTPHIDALVQRADHKMYEAKEAGRNLVKA